MQSTKQAHEPILISITEAARLLGVSKEYCYTATISGQWPSVKIGRRRLMRLTDIKAIATGKKKDRDHSPGAQSTSSEDDDNQNGRKS